MSRTVPPTSAATIGWVRDPEGSPREVRWDARSGRAWVACGAWLYCGRARCVEDALRAAEAALFLS